MTAAYEQGVTPADGAGVPDGPPMRRLRLAELQATEFRRTSFGRRGYDEQDVDSYVTRSTHEIARLVEDKAALRADLERLRDRFTAEFGRTPEDDAAASGPRVEDAQVQAVTILSRAQQTADEYVAGAEDYSRQLTASARVHYDELLGEARTRADGLLQEAHQRATLAGDTAARRYRDGAGEVGDAGGFLVEKEELERQIAYLQTFSHACRIQLRSFLEALIGDIEREWGRADPAAIAGPPGIGPGATAAGLAGSGAAGSGVAGVARAAAPPGDRVPGSHSVRPMG